MSGADRRVIGKSVTITPTLDTSAYVSGDVLATAVIPFAGLAPSGFVEKLVVTDKIKQKIAGELWLFSATVTPAAANAAHSISDADAALLVGVIPFGVAAPDASQYYDSALNSSSVVRGVNLAFTAPNSTLYGILVTRGTPTYGATDLVLTLHVSPD